MKITVSDCLQQNFEHARLIYYPFEILDFIFNSLKLETKEIENKWINYYAFLDKFRIIKGKTKYSKNPCFSYLFVFKKDNITIFFMQNHSLKTTSFIGVFIFVNKTFVSKKFFTFIDSRNHKLLVSQKDLKNILKTQNTLLKNFNNIKI